MIEEEREDNYKVRFNYKENGEILGYVLIEETVDIINIVNVFVNEKDRRKGVATKLFDFIIDKYKSKKEKIMLEVRESNNAAIKLYKKMNFKEIHIRKNYYKGEDAIIMEVYL